MPPPPPPLICLWLATGAAFAIASVSVCLLRTKWKDMESKLRELEKSLATSLENCTAERQGRVRAQQALRKAMLQGKSDKNLKETSFPMTPIGVVQSCFSTRGTLAGSKTKHALARACLVFDPARVPVASLEGLEEYSHCWVIFVFHLNTNLDKLWKDPSQSKSKAKVRVPRLEGGRMGVFATRSPHRSIPIGLTVAKIEAVKGHMILLSGVDLVDGTPVLDVKPYLPYCDSVQEACVPDWIMADNLLAVPSVSFSTGFSSALSECWESLENNSLYASAAEIQTLIEQILSWDIRSSSQRNRPHKSTLASENSEQVGDASGLEQHTNKDSRALVPGNKHTSSGDDVVYHLIVEGLDITYKIDRKCNVVVEGASLDPATTKSKQRGSNYLAWEDKLR